MAFIKLTERLGFVFGFQRYDHNPQLNGVQQILLSGQEILDPENINAYDVYSTTPHLYAVIQRRGDLLASGVWKHYRLVNGKKKEVENSEIVNILENPSVLYKGNDYLRLINENKCVYGNVYLYLSRPYRSSIPMDIKVLPSNDVRIVKTGKWYKQTKIKNIIERYELISSNDVLDIQDVYHSWIQNSKNPLQGETPLKNIYMPISNLRLALRFRNTIMAKHGALGVLSNASKDSAGTLNVPSKERKRIEKQFQNDYGIQEGKSSIIITQNELKWNPMSYPTKDLMLFEEDENDFAQVCDCYGIKRDVFASTKGATFENQKEALKQTYQSTIIPEAEEIAMYHSSIFGMDGRTEFLELDYSHIPVLQENEVEKAQVMNNMANSIASLISAGYTKDEAYQILGIKKPL